MVLFSGKVGKGSAHPSVSKFHSNIWCDRSCHSAMPVITRALVHAVNLHLMQRWQYRFAGAGFEDFGDAGRAVEW